MTRFGIIRPWHVICANCELTEFPFNSDFMGVPLDCRVGTIATFVFCGPIPARLKAAATFTLSGNSLQASMTDPLYTVLGLLEALMFIPLCSM